jgi:CelD/BcsL family acetyltransferase involved in cellulose biosynthesis
MRSSAPGIVLFAERIRTAIARGFTAFDFMRGNESYKYRFGATDQPLYQLACPHCLPGAGVVPMSGAPRTSLSLRRVAMFSVHSCPLAPWEDVRRVA